MIFEAFKAHRAERPDDPAFLIASGDRYVPVSWKRFTDDIATVCWIAEKYAPGAKIALLGENSYEWMVAHAACLFSGGVAVPLEPALSADEIAKRLKSVGAAVLLHSALYAEKAHDVARLVPGLSTGGFGSRKTDFFLGAAVKALGLLRRTVWHRDAPDPSRTATMVFTSGTTSEPRAVELSLAAIETFVDSTARALPMSPGDRSLMLLPLHHIFGIAATYTMLAGGVAMGVCPDFRRIYDAFERFRADFAFLVPALADILAAKIERKARSAEAALGQPIRWLLTGGAPLSRRTYERLTALGVKTISGYGLTETAACYSMAFEADEMRPTSAGRVSTAPGVETKVSQDGELLVRGPCVMKGYYGMPERTAQAIDAEGWFHTGDAGRIDSDGYVWIRGRMSRTIVLSSGKKVAPEEIEEKLLALPGVMEAVVSGEGESRNIRAEVYASVPEESVRRVVASLNQTLPVYQRIKTTVVRAEPFPRTASGKIMLSVAAMAMAALSAFAAPKPTYRAAPPDFRVGTFNIRCVSTKDKGARSWNVRKGDVAFLIRKLNCDVIGLQEVTPPQMKFLKERMGADYGFVGEFRNSDRKSGEAVPVCYRKSRFDLVKGGTFWLSKTPDRPGSRSWGTSLPRSCSWALLKDKASGRRLCFANTHTDHKSNAARVNGVKVVAGRLAKVSEGAPVVLVGDHNCSDDEEPAAYLRKVYDDAMFVSRKPPLGPWRSFSAWNKQVREVSAAAALRMKPGDRANGRVHRIDFIYVSKKAVDVMAYITVNARRKAVDEYYSDHFPVLAKIRIR